jgi:aspartyl-tRNA(Asn)/glutamyl-tRNA(Gln) amidotransferase subunit B
VSHGKIDIVLTNGEQKTIGVTRIHIEQDAGKSLHDQSPDESFIDLNRSGIALMEIVTEPDMRSAEEAAEFLKKLRSILRYLGTCDGDMEKGSMRCDVNVSVMPKGSKEYGTRVEVKNVNSIKFLVKAVHYEVQRQIELIESGQEVSQETRLFDSNKEETRSMRKKEDSIDYRYFPDPDLPPIKLTSEYIEKIRQDLPELPEQKMQRYKNTMGLSEYDAELLVSDKQIASYFESVAALADPKMSANWIAAELFAKLNKADLEIDASPVTPKNLARLIELIKTNVISGKIAKQLFEIMFETQDDPDALLQKHNLVQITDDKAISELVDQIMDKHPDKVAEYKAGKTKLYGFFVGEAMKQSEGKVSPEILNRILQLKLGSVN